RFVDLQTPTGHIRVMTRRAGSADVTRRPRSAVVSRPDDPARCRHVRGHRPSLWSGRAVATTRKSLLVSVVRCRHGHGLAFLWHYNERNWSAQTRFDAASQ